MSNKTRWLFVWMILLSVSSINAAKISVDARLDSVSMLIGNQNRLYLEVSVPNTSVVTFPAFSGDTIVTGVDIVSQTDIDSSNIENNRKRLEKEYLLTSFEEGLYYIPPMTVSVDGEVYESNYLSLKVMTYEVDTANVQICDIKPLLKVPFVIWDYSLYVGLVLLLIACILLVIYWTKHRASKAGTGEAIEPEMLLPPHVAAIQALNEIKAEKIWTQGQYKEFYTQLTDVLRKYISRRFGVSAMEMTSSEILSILKKDKEAKEVYQQLSQILTLSDFVKFAKMNPLPEENESSIAKAYLFVETTKQETPEETEPSPEIEKTDNPSAKEDETKK